MFNRSGEAAFGHLRALVIGAIIVLLPLALITTNVRGAISERAVYDYSVQHYDAQAATGVPESELLRANGILHSYLTASDPGPLAITVRDQAGKQETLFSAKETAHMADVRTLVQGVFTLQLIAVAALLTLAVVAIAVWPARVLAAALLAGSLLTGAVIGLAGLAAVSGFDSAWSQFHGIAFSNDLWKLDPRTDHLIQMFPENFWMLITVVLGLATLVEAAVIGTVAGAYLYLTGPRDVESPVRRFLPGPRPRPQIPPRLSPPDPRHYAG